MPSGEEKGKIGEHAFARLCEKWHYEFLYIHQGLETLSSELFINKEKRPDFLVNISDVAPIFVEVKTKVPGYVKEDYGFPPREPAFGEEHERLDKMRNFERSMGLNVWYAFFEDKGRVIDQTTVHLCPISRIEKFVPQHLIGNYNKWRDIWVPIKCMNRCQDCLDLTNKCNTCMERRCKGS